MLKVSAELKDLNLSDLLEGIVPFPAAAVAVRDVSKSDPQTAQAAITTAI